MAESWEQVDLSELAGLADDAGRRRFFARRPELRRPELAWRLAVESGQALRVDLEKAAALAAVAGWLARQTGSRLAQARARRATANVLHFQRRYEEAVAAYDEALAGFASEGAEIEAAVTRSSASGSLSHLARYGRAMEYAKAARRTFRKHGDLLHLGRLEVNVGLLHARQDRFPEAIERFGQAMELFEEVGQPVDVASTLRNIAVCHQDLNDFPSSLEAYATARDYCLRHGLPLIGLEVEYNIAYLYYQRGEYSEAIRRFEAARRQSAEHGDPHHAALCDLDLAEIFLELNLVHDARHLARKAFAAFAELGMEYETAKALAYQALAAQRGGDSREALELLSRAGASFGRQDNQVWTAMVELFQALVLLADGRLEEAALHADAAAAGFEECGVPSRSVLCEVLRSRLAVRFGDLEAARRRARRALELARTTGRPLLEFHAHLVAGETAEAARRPQIALERYESAHQALERLRGQLPTDELRIAFADDKRAVYEGLVAITLAQGRSATEAERALRWVETAKSRSLSDMLTMGASGGGATAATGDPTVGEVRELRRELNWYYRQIDSQELVYGDNRRRRLERLRHEVERRERRLLRALRRLQTGDAELSSLHGASVADADSLRDVLPEGGALIEYVVARGRIYVFRLDRRSIAVQELGAESRLAELHRLLRFQLDKFRAGGDYVERFGHLFEGQTTRLLQELHRALLGDGALVEGVDHLVVVPHGFLHQIPFHALHDGDRHLIDRLSVSYAPSATVFRLCSLRPARSNRHSLVVGVPDQRAPRILDEARAVAEILTDSRLLLGEEATRDRLCELGNGCRYLHLATHGLYRRENPMFSALQLGDTRLSLVDLYDLELRTELAMLSGCATGLGDVRGSDELVGLTRGFLFAGARSVAASLWEVDDESTAHFMRHFYSLLTAGEGPSAALRHAMLSLRVSHPHPYYWAPFVLTGRP